ncbi:MULTISPECIES: GntR family transcriptional regulator [Citricoccus]|mgnify:CR=1 FL=1|uniref:DNA-binding GntR family transcriptional regulator n=1 Tax=Citricoccus muralis TaxID=169134 RepID=A0A3D9LFH4_9MICC|nr:MULTISPECIES: GntR family transcriptional regulator [Citricoccus]REE05005.1 DNA-binding GntR family transcriptional regulator [Citricoccus muralis]VXA90776.1 DNA-binding GntR family transcriptional regulator [Citricoccus sp. K5]
MATATRTSAAVNATDVADQIRAAIFAGELVPNQRLVEADLAEMYGASRGHVRTALSELTVEGLVERIQNRGARVRSVPVEEAIEIVEVRSALEALCAARAAMRITDAEAEELRQIGRSMETAVETGDQAAYAQGNTDLHSTLIRLSGQKTAAATIDRLRAQAVRFQYRLFAKPGRSQQSLPEHLAIIDAVCAREPEEAARAMREHLMSVGAAIEESVRSGA